MKDMVFSFRIRMLMVFFGLLSVSQSSGEIPVEIASHLTRMENEHRIAPLESGNFYVKITTTNSFGYAEHFIAGEYLDQGSKDSNVVPIAFLQSFRIDKESGEFIVFRKRLEPKPDWSIVENWLADTKAYQSNEVISSSSSENFADGIVIDVTVHAEGREIHYSLQNPDDRASLLMNWLLLAEDIYDFEFSMLSLDLLRRARKAQNVEESKP